MDYYYYEILLLLLLVLLVILLLLSLFISLVRIPFGDHPLTLERYREDWHGPCARMTRTDREV